MKLWKQHLTTKIATSFLLLSLIAVGVVGGVTFMRARDSLKNEAFKRLNVAATLKEQDISRWFDLQREDFLLLVEFSDVETHLKTILSPNVSQSEYQAAYTALHNYLQEIQQVKSNFQEISLLDRSNKIVISTNKSREGRYESLANISYVDFPPIFYVSSETNKPAVTLAKILGHNQGEHQGIVLANLNLKRIDEIVRERAGLGKTGETYLVGSLGDSKRTFIAKEEVRDQYSQYVGDRHNPQGISEGIDLAMGGISGAGLYRNYAQIPVLGDYRRLSDQQDLALIVEISQQEAFAPARQLANTVMFIGLMSAALLLLAVYYLSIQLSIYRKQSENYSHQLEAKAQEAETANHAKSEFLANMSHELRTPLNAILGFAQLMERDQMSSQQRESLATINRSGEHLLSLINDVLDMSKIEAGRAVLHSEPFNLHLLLQTLEEMFQLRATAKGLFFKFDLDPHLPRYIITDEGKLRQVLINLLGNAIKFTETGGIYLRVSTYKDRGREGHEDTRTNKNKLPHTSHPSISLYFEVKDTGKGIAPFEIDKIFAPFVQTASGVQARGGTGLGLAISRQFLRLMGGDIYVDSILGQGSTFSFDIQVDLSPTAPEAYMAKKRVLKVASSQPDYRILVVDDRPENRDLLAKLLNIVGFDTRTAANGAEAIALWETWLPHLIWMDMRMEIVDGYEATRQIKARSQTQKTVIIALTASAFAQQQSAIFAAGCDDLVRKPFQEEIIFEKMRQYLGVEYIYEDQLESAKTSVNHNTNLTLEDLSVMPAEWIAALHQAALKVDADLVLQIIEQIPEKHHSLAEKLRKLTSQYDFDTIIDMS